MIHWKLTCKVAEANLIVLLERALNWLCLKVGCTKDQKAALWHIPNKLRLIELECKRLDDSLLDEFFDLILEIPPASICLANDTQVDYFAGKVENIVHVEAHVAFVKIGLDWLDVSLVPPRHSHRVLETLKFEERYRLLLGWLDV